MMLLNNLGFGGERAAEGGGGDRGRERKRREDAVKPIGGAQMEVKRMNEYQAQMWRGRETADRCRWC